MSDCRECAFFWLASAGLHPQSHLEIVLERQRWRGSAEGSEGVIMEMGPDLGWMWSEAGTVQ